jgi:hypothetical protein
MTPLHSKPVLPLLLAALLVLSGCARKKPVLVVPQEQPPVPTATPTPTPDSKAESDKTEPAAQPAVAEKTEKTDTTTATATNNKPRRPHGVIKKPSPALKAENNPPEPRTTPEPRSTPAPIAPVVSQGQANRDHSSTDQLLQNTEANLNGIKRQLSKDEEAMVAQIRNYMNQSRQASKDNDPARARTLALKANLLSNELVSQR